MKKNNIKVLLSGSSFSGNKGAEAMYDSIVDELSNYYDSIEVTILSKYPEDDKCGCEERGYKLVLFSTIEQLTYGGLFYLFGGACKKLHLPYKWMAGKRILPFFENDIMIDASGIAFTDDRSFANVLINTLWFLPALITDIPAVKVSQTLGPYKKWYVRLFSTLVLKHLKIIICRGNESYDYTASYLKKDNIYNYPDTAFCLKPCNESEADHILRMFGLQENNYIAVGPSFVMRDYLPSGVYTDILADCINKISVSFEKKIAFIPHSWKHSKKIGVDAINDDLAVCREIIIKLNPEVNYTLIDTEMNARELKCIIGHSFMAMGSRYHFLIAALSSGVPSMAMGWSHKYNELFREFDIEEFVVGYQDMNKEVVYDMAQKLYNDCKMLREQISSLLPKVIQASKMNEKLIAEYLESAR